MININIQFEDAKELLTFYDLAQALQDDQYFNGSFGNATKIGSILVNPLDQWVMDNTDDWGNPINN